MKKGGNGGGRPNKKLKMEHSGEQEDDKVRESLLSSIQPVLAEEEERSLVLLDVYAAHINPKDASKIIKAIEKFEFPELGHLKRIKKELGKEKKEAPQLSILLCTREFWRIFASLHPSFVKELNLQNETSQDPPATQNLVDPVNQKVMADFMSFLQNFSLSPFPTRVPLYPPISREQYDLWTPIWPCIYRTHIYSTPLPASLSTPELQEMRNFMLLAILEAKKAKLLGQRPIGAIFVDPATKEVVARAYDQTKLLDPSTPHSSSSSSSSSSSPSLTSSTSPTSTSPSSIQSSPNSTFPIFGHPLAHACMNCIAALGKQLVEKYSTPQTTKVTSNTENDNKGDNNTNNTNNNDNNNNNNNSNINTINNNNNNEQNTIQTEDPTFIQYLATGYHLYTTKEPCAMCAMALIHSRVTRVIYGTSDPQGALGSQFRIHTVKSLNHHFQVYKEVAKNECKELLIPN